jgi:uncharacterized membrane protein
MLLTVHIAAGALAMILGAVALSVKKGSAWHRRSGLLFVYAMLVMAGSASVLGFFKGPTDPNVFAGILTAYFVGTALTAVRPVSASTRAITATAMMVAILLGLATVANGVTMVNTPGLDSGGVPFRIKGSMTIFIGVVLLLAGFGDARALRAGVLRGAARLKRHLWRMCFALFIAAGSFFSMRERVATILPEPFLPGPIRMLPIALVFGAMFYWLWKLRARGKQPSITLTPGPQES